MVLEPVDRNQHYRARRRKARRRTRIRRLATLAFVLAIAGAAALVIRGGDEAPEQAAATVANPATPKPKVLRPRPLPVEMRGVHVTMALASIPGKLEGYMSMRGLNTIQLDIKDENGEVGFVPSAVPLAREIGAAKSYYQPRPVVKLAHEHGVYLIGRIVCFEDPVLAEQRPDMAIKFRDGSIWRNHAGLGWTNPYDKRVWDYIADLGETAARAGFDEIQLDYVRFPSDGDVENMVFAGKTETPPGWVIAEFVHYVSKRLKPLGVRVSADVFGLSATRDLGIGQVPRRIARYLDVIYPMVYPSHYSRGEYNLDDPNAAPGATVAASLRDFKRELRGQKTKIIPWLQDFDYGRDYTLADVQDQIDSARLLGSPGFLLWNAAGVYTPEALTYEPSSY